MSGFRWLQLVLAVSLAINLLIAGAAIGRWRDREPPMNWATQSLDPATREAIKPLLRQRMGSTKALRRQLHERQTRIRQLIRQPVLDKAALAEELAALRSVTDNYQLALHKTAVDVLADLNPAQRKRVAAKLLAPMQGHRPPPAGSPPGRRQRLDHDGRRPPG